MKKVIRLAGTARSRSTLLDLMVGHSPKGFSVGEINALFRPWRSRHLLEGRGCFCGDINCSFWSEIKNGGDKRVYYNLFQKLPHIDFIVDSSKNPIWIMDQMRYSVRYNYSIIPILIFKTPLEFAYSVYKRGNLKGWYDRWVKTHLRLFQILDHSYSIKYQDLAKNPQEMLRSLCQVLGIRYFPGKENFWDNDSKHFLYGSSTVRNSDNLIYYDEQYQEEKLNYLQETIDWNYQIMNDVLTILKAYEVNSGDRMPKSVKELRRKIECFPFLDFLEQKARNTMNYRLNRRLPKLVYWIKRALRKGRKLSNSLMSTNGQGDNEFTRT